MTSDATTAHTMLRAAIDVVRQRGPQAKAPGPKPIRIVLDEVASRDRLIVGVAGRGKSRYPHHLTTTSRKAEPMNRRTDEELQRVPRPALNGGQMACVSARYALEETPALAHFAAVHRHVEEILGTVAVNDNKEWMLGNIARVRSELDLLEQALDGGTLPMDLTHRHRSTYMRTDFVGIPSGLRQPLDASKGWRDHSVAYRPKPPRSQARDLLYMAVALFLLALAYALLH
ncbi:hypothetical protein [Streptomyces tendae]|uniref:hypothetical protein n=1 Tax=Streptomyces tendae TaxID=1932 RepID=UPI003EBD90A3